MMTNSPKRLATRIAPVVVSIAMLIGAGSTVRAASPDSTLQRIRQDGTIRLGYRADAAPFSYLDKSGKPAGFMVDLCRAVSANIAHQLGLPDLKVAYVPVSVTDRFATIQQRKADLLCEATTVTIARRKVVDFSIATFVDGAGILIPSGGPSEFRALAGHKIGVLAGTTAERDLRQTLKNTAITADVVPVESHAAGVAMLDEGKIAAYFADRSILARLIGTSKAPDKLSIANSYFSIDPFALALAHGDDDFRLAVDSALSQIYRTDQIQPIFETTFGTSVAPSQILRTLYVISALPE